MQVSCSVSCSPAAKCRLALLLAIHPCRSSSCVCTANGPFPKPKPTCKPNTANQCCGTVSGIAQNTCTTKNHGPSDAHQKSRPGRFSRLAKSRCWCLRQAVTGHLAIQLGFSNRGDAPGSWKPSPVTVTVTGHRHRQLTVPGHTQVA